MKADQTTTDSVTNVLTSVFTLHKERKADEIMALFSPDADVCLYGTDVEERRVGQDGIRAQIVKDFGGGDDYTFELNNILVSSSGSVAWIAADAVHHTTEAGKKIRNEARLTAVLEERDGKWLICQWHKSKPVKSE